MRHPRPLTPAEIYDQCEKEQEAAVRTRFCEPPVSGRLVLTATTGQPLDSRTHCLASSERVCSVQCFPVVQLDLSIAFTGRHR